jgi:hypothetical protein
MQQGHLCDFVPSQNQDKAGNRLGSAWLTYGDVLSARRFTSFAGSLLGASSLIVVFLRCFSMRMIYVSTLGRNLVAMPMLLLCERARKQAKPDKDN